jgi:4-hydroxy-tetrahydrodipicolinate synthase
MSMGAYGIISVVAHLAGNQIHAMLDAFVAGRPTEAAAAHARLLPLFQVCFREPNPMPVKAALELLGLPAGPVRLPLIPASSATITAVRAELERLELL